MSIGAKEARPDMAYLRRRVRLLPAIAEAWLLLSATLVVSCAETADGAQWVSRNVRIDALEPLSRLTKPLLGMLQTDRSFANYVTGGQTIRTLVSTIISLVHSLKLTVVAKAIEIADQPRPLASLTRDEMRGFLSGEPEPSEIFEARHLGAAALA
jgi:hypothetical protein